MDRDQNQRLRRAGQGGRERSRREGPRQQELEADGKADEAAGKLENAIGGLKDAVRGK